MTATMAQDTLSIKQRLLEIMQVKQTALCLAADVKTMGELINLAKLCGPSICLLKMHADIIKDFNVAAIHELKKLAKEHNFLIIEDRKFADIGSVMKEQYESGTFRIADWADIIICHGITGAESVACLVDAAREHRAGLLLIAQLSTAGNLIDTMYTQNIYKIARKYSDTVLGFISQERFVEDDQFLFMTPGVHNTQVGDAQGQRYNNLQTLFWDKGIDIVVVGRAIYQANDPAMEAEKYRKEAWDLRQELKI